MFLSLDHVFARREHVLSRIEYVLVDSQHVLAAGEYELAANEYVLPVWKHVFTDGEHVLARLEHVLADGNHMLNLFYQMGNLPGQLVGGGRHVEIIFHKLAAIWQLVAPAGNPNGVRIIQPRVGPSRRGEELPWVIVQIIQPCQG